MLNISSGVKVFYFYSRVVFWSWIFCNWSSTVFSSPVCGSIYGKCMNKNTNHEKYVVIPLHIQFIYTTRLQIFSDFYSLLFDDEGKKKQQMEMNEETTPTKWIK